MSPSNTYRCCVCLEEVYEAASDAIYHRNLHMWIEPCRTGRGRRIVRESPRVHFLPAFLVAFSYPSEIPWCHLIDVSGSRLFHMEEVYGSSS